ncbi:hypothetical protein MUP65_02780 [Patescibacteria group bacterium]|nr:hypothetical protein [Patescibacteria group bacterium]
MKKGVLYGLVGLVLVGLIGGGVFVFIRKGRVDDDGDQPLPTPERYLEVEVKDAPFISLIPSADAHWLTVGIERIRDAETVEYELAYETADGVTQGAIGGPYPVPEDGKYEKRILLGTESSGHYRYHEGVVGGSLTVRLGGGIGARRFTADFILTNEEPLSSSDGVFVIETAKFDGWVVVMPTFGLPDEAEVSGQPYGVFSAGSVEIDLSDISFEKDSTLVWNGKRWIENVQAVFGLEMAFVTR